MGIVLGSNFDLQTALPLDSRTVVADLTARDAIEALVRYEGMIVYVQSELTNYQLIGGVDNGDWLELSGGGGAGGGTSIIFEEYDEAPIKSFVNGMSTYLMEAGLGQRLYSEILVPSSYEQGNQIRLKVNFYAETNTGTVLIDSVSSLLKNENTLFNANPDTHTSTNVAITMDGSKEDTIISVILDLTDASGEVNGNPVEPGDTLKFYVKRGTDTYSGRANLLHKQTEVFFE